MSGELYCPACKALVPLSTQHGGKAIGLAFGGTLAILARTFLGKLASAVIPVVVGHVIDQAASAVCGTCGRPTTRAA